MSGLSDTTRGILLMIGTICCFSVMDTIAKGMAVRFDTVQVVWARYAFQTLIAVAILLPRLATVLRTRYPVLQVIRSGFLFGATLFFFLGFTTIGLAKAAAIFMVNPLFITLGAALVLGEPLGLRRIGAVLAGLVGALVIIRPGMEGFTLADILPLLAAACYAGYAISTRFLGQEESVWTSFLYTTLIGTVVATGIVPAYWSPPGIADYAIFLGMAAIGSLGHLMLIRAFSLAEAAVLAPFGYLSVINATLLGYAFFAEVPDLPTYLGAIVIVGSGLYTWHRETRLNRAAVTA